MDQRPLQQWARSIVVIVLLSAILIPATALGSWRLLLNEHFQLPAVTWPWGNWHLGVYG